MKFYQKYIKRIIDLGGALIFIILMSPIFFAIWLIVRFTMGNPVVITQKRAGFHGKIFNLYKFRTMSIDKDSNGELLPDELRITTIGALLRKTSLDEIPQFFNVLKGDMSFIGPRPFMDYELEICKGKAMARHNVLPGLSGLAQISGRNEISVEEKIRIDLQYVEKISLLLDSKIFFLTIIQVLFCINSTPVNKNTVDRYIKDTNNKI